jgi:signal transduction histidine kinase
MRIAQDMHDEIGSKLTKISFMSERAIGELEGHPPVAEKLDSIARTSRDLLQSLDEIVWAVNPHNDTLEHLAAYLGQYATEYLQNTAVQCELRIARGLPNYPLSAEARHNLFLAFEESLNNALKHGRASAVQIEMRVDGSLFRIRVQDNGSGFDSQSLSEKSNNPGRVRGTAGGNGLQNMRQRLAMLGGNFEIESQPGQGTVVCFTVPLTARIVADGKK